MEYGGLPRISRQEAKNPLVNVYECKDGSWLALLMMQPDRYWSDFCKATGLQHLENDPTYCDLLNCFMKRIEFIAILDKVFLTKTRSEWIKIFKNYDILWDPCNTFIDMENDAQVNASGAFIGFEHPTNGDIKVPATPIDINDTLLVVRMRAPELGEHTEHILLENGYGWEGISQLKDSLAIL